MKQKLHWFKLFPLLVLALATAGCGASTDLTGMWEDPTLAQGEFKKILVIGLTDNEAMRRAFEAEMAAEFGARGVEAVASADHMDLSAEVNEENLRATFSGMGIDCVLASRLLGVDEKAAYMPGETYVVPYDYYHGFYGYYSTAYPVVSTPGYWTTYSVAKMETNVYRVGDAKLVWGGVSETFDYSNAMDAMKSYAHTVVGKLVQNGYFTKTK